MVRAYEKVRAKNKMSRASSSFQKVEPSQAELLKTPGSRAYFRAEPRLDPSLVEPPYTYIIQKFDDATDLDIDYNIKFEI